MLSVGTQVEPGHVKVNQSKRWEGKWEWAKGEGMVCPGSPILRQTPKESKNSKFRPGLSDHCKGTLIKAGEWDVFGNTLWADL